MKRTPLEVTIEQGIPIPAPRRSPRLLKYPWDKMNVGDSALIPVNSRTSKESIRASAIIYGKRNNMEFVSRVAEGGMRVWRIR